MNLGEFKKDFFEFVKAVLCIDAVFFALLCLFGQFSLPLVFGFFVGIVLVSLEFYLIIVHTMGAVQPEGNAKRNAMGGYFIRYIIIGIVLVVCIKVPLINEWVVIAHLIYPRLIFTIKAILRKES